MWMSILYLQPHINQSNLAASTWFNPLKPIVLSPGVETPPLASTALPVAAVPRILFRFDVEVIDMIHQVLQGIKEQMAL